MEKKKESLHDILKRVCVCTKKVEEFYKKYDELDDIYRIYIKDLKIWLYNANIYSMERNSMSNETKQQYQDGLIRDRDIIRRNFNDLKNNYASFSENKIPAILSEIGAVKLALQQYSYPPKTIFISAERRKEIKIARNLLKEYQEDLSDKKDDIKIRIPYIKKLSYALKSVDDSCFKEKE